MFGQHNHSAKSKTCLRHVAETFKIIFPKNLLSATDEKLYDGAITLTKKYKEDIATEFPTQLLSIRQHFRSDLENSSTVSKLFALLVCENSTMCSSFHEVLNVIILFLTIPVTVASAERSFSKLRLIKNYLRSTMAQERLSGLSVISIENRLARNINFEKVTFADMKVRKVEF